MLLGAPGIVRAQVSPAAYGAAEWDWEDLRYYMAGASLAVGATAIRPVFSASAAGLTYPRAPRSTNTITIATLDAGLARVFSGGALTFVAGYAFASEDDQAAFGAPTGGRDTPYLSAQYAHWGSGRVNRGIIVSYATQSEYFWTRGRVAVAAREWTPERTLRLGGEAVYQARSSVGSVANYSSFQVGPLLDFAWNRHLRTAVVAGFKTDNRPQTSLFPYLKFEFLVLP